MTLTYKQSRARIPEDGGGVAVMDVSRHLADYPDLLTVRDLCELTGLSAQTIRAEINSGNLPGFRIGRRLYVSKKHLLEYIENGGGLND